MTLNLVPSRLLNAFGASSEVGAGGGADDQFLLHRLLDRGHARGVPGDADMHLAVEVADPAQLGRIVVGADEAEQRRLGHAALHRGDGEPVRRRDFGDIARRAQSAGARHVLHHEGRIAGYEPAEMTCKEPRKGVEAAGWSGCDHDPHRLPAEEVFRRRLRHGWRGQQRDDARGAKRKHQPPLVPAQAGTQNPCRWSCKPGFPLARE